MTQEASRDAAGMDVLVLGGTAWLGAEIARQAMAAGHRATCLARGESGRPPEGARWVRADRDDLAALDEVADRSWDCVVEVSWQPRWVRAAVRRLAGAVRHWIYVSSCSVYSDDDHPFADEDDPLHEPWSGDEPVTWEHYGPAKVACEEACEADLGADRLLIARSGLIGGYGDRSDRLGYWLARLDRAIDGEEVLVPPREAPFQVVDVADLAAFLVAAAEHRTSGVVNVAGEITPLGSVLGLAADVTHRSVRWVEADDSWLSSHDVEPWAGVESLPLWLPMPEYAGFMARRNDAAVQAGLRFRPLRQTLESSLIWERELGVHRADRRAGLSPEHERRLIEELTS